MVALALTGCSGTAKKQVRTPRPDGLPKDYPNKTIEICHGFGAGSMTESFVRLVMDNIKEKEGWDNGFTIGFHEGGSGAIGWTYTASAKPDGYTLGIVQGTSMIRPISENEQGWGLDKFSYICNMMTSPGAIAVAADSKYQTLTDLIDDAKANPGKVTIALGGLTSSDGLACRQVEMATGVEFNKIPAGDEESAPMVLGGFADAAWLNEDDFAAYLETGQMRLLATGDDQRSPFSPDVPTYKECGVDVKQANFRSICGPAGMDPVMVQYLQDCWVNAMNDPDLQKAAESLKVPYQIRGSAETYELYKAWSETLQALWDKEPWQ